MRTRTIVVFLALGVACADAANEDGGGGPDPTCCDCTCAVSGSSMTCTASAHEQAEQVLDCDAECAQLCSNQGCPTVTSAEHCAPSEGGGNQAAGCGTGADCPPGQQCLCAVSVGGAGGGPADCSCEAP